MSDIFSLSTRIKHFAPDNLVEEVRELEKLYNSFKELFDDLQTEIKMHEKIVISIFDKIGEKKLLELLGKELANQFVKFAGIRCELLEPWHCYYCDIAVYSDTCATNEYGGSYCSAKCADEYKAYKAAGFYSDRSESKHKNEVVSDE